MAVRAGLRNWKDSAGVILISGAFKYARPPTPISELVNLGENPLIVPLDELDSSGSEWTFTMVQRGSKTGFYANSHVFPGGKIDQSDSSPRWLELFRHCSNSHSDPFQSIMALRDHSSSIRLPIYEAVPKGPIEGEIALRICAIRELFEEAGVLLARDNKDTAGAVQSLPGTIPPAVKELTTREMNHWRSLVHSRPEEFLNLCTELECVPDIWGLLEWSDWLTPRNLPIRYDTLFYVCFIDTQPPVEGDGEEIVDAQWFTPSEAIQLFLDHKIQITPPQFAEVNVLKSLGPVPCLHSYALREALKGSVSRTSAVRILAKDRVVLSLMNTDDIYPAISEEEALSSPPPHPPRSPALTHIPLHPSESRGYEYECRMHTAEELRDLCTNLCRMEFHEEGNFFFYDNMISDKVNRHKEDYYRYRNLASKL